MAKNNNLTDFTTDLATTIRNKCKITGTINPQDFSEFVDGMPFFEKVETFDIISTADTGFELPAYSSVYFKYRIYLTNDNGLTEIPADDGTAIIGVFGFGSADSLLMLNSTEQVEIVNPFWTGSMVNFDAYFVGMEDNGESLISAGWHIMCEKYAMKIGKPNGKSTYMVLNTANGGGTL